MKSLKWLGVVSVEWALALFACANGSTVAEDEQEVVTPATDAAAAEDSFRPSLRDGATTPTDSGATADASKSDATSPDSSTGVDSSVPPTDSGGTGLPPACDPGNPVTFIKAGVQIDNNDMPPCDATCRGCCWFAPPFCVKPI